MSVPNKVDYQLVSNNLRHRFGIDALTERYNDWRLRDDRKPVSKATVNRYCDSGRGYENGPPSDFKIFAAHLALCLLST